MLGCRRVWVSRLLHEIISRILPDTIQTRDLFDLYNDSGYTGRCIHRPIVFTNSFAFVGYIVKYQSSQIDCRHLLLEVKFATLYIHHFRNDWCLQSILGRQV